MTPETKEASGKLLISVLTIVTTVVASNMGVDYRGAERAEAVKTEVGNVATQNQEILKGISALLDQKLEATAKAGEANMSLNKSILKGTEANQDMNATILKRLDALEQKIK